MQHKIHDVFGRVTKEEARARNGVYNSMRLAYLANAAGEEQLRERAAFFDSTMSQDTPLWQIWECLLLEQKAKLRDIVNNPAVRVNMKRDGKTYDPFTEPQQDVLRRLEQGEYVGPLTETQVQREVGNKAI